MPIKLYSWNVNGIRAVIRKELFMPFIDKHQPDILCLQETKAQQGQAEIDLPDYYEYWNSAEKKGYSGTALFSKVKPLSITHNLVGDIAKQYGIINDGFGDPDKEGRMLTAEFTDFYVVTVYTINSKDDLGRLDLRHKQWDPAFLAHCKALEDGLYGLAAKPVLFCGDLNVAYSEDDLANPKPNVGKRGFTNEERAGFQHFLDAGFIDTFRMFTKGNGHYSWWTHWANARARNIGWRIDYVMVSAALKTKVQTAAIHADVMGSDHCPVSIEIDANL